MPKLKLPTPWLYRFDELAAEWGCPVGRVEYYVDCGLITPGVAVPRWKLVDKAPAGPSPFVVVMLDEFRDLDWVHAEGESVADLRGTFRAFAIDLQNFASFQLRLDEPIVITRRDLVVPLEQKEHLEQVEDLAFIGAANSIERRTLMMIVGALLKEDPAMADRGPYQVAKIIKQRLASVGMRVSHETAAAKVKEARQMIASAAASKLGSVLRVGIDDLSSAAIS